MAQSVMERKAQSPHTHRSDGRLRVVVYCRINPDSDNSLNSLEAQRTYYTQEIQAHPDWKLAGIFADEGLTGADIKRRPGFNRMMSACKRGSVDVILTRSVTRFSRCLHDVLKTIRSLKAMGVNVIFEKENIDTASDNQEFQTAVYDLFATLESECITLNLIYPISGPRMK